MRLFRPTVFLLGLFAGLACAADVPEKITIEIEEIPVSKELLSTGRKKLWKIIAQNNSTESRYVAWRVPNSVEFGMSCIENGVLYEIIQDCNGSFRTFVFPHGPLGAKVAQGDFVEVTVRGGDKTTWVMDPTAYFSVYEQSLKSRLLKDAETVEGNVLIPAPDFRIVPVIKHLLLAPEYLRGWANDLSSEYPENRDVAMRLIANAGTEAVGQLKEATESIDAQTKSAARTILIARDGELVIERFERCLKNVKTIAGEIHKDGWKGRISAEIDGRVAFQIKPVDIESARHCSEIIVADGSNLWWESHGGGFSASNRPYDYVEKGPSWWLEGRFLGIYLISNPKAIRVRMTWTSVSEQKIDDVEYEVLDVRCRNDTAGWKLLTWRQIGGLISRDEHQDEVTGRLYFDKTAGRLAIVKLDSHNGWPQDIRISDVKLDSEIDAKMFDYKPADGLKVIDVLDKK